MTTEEIKKIEGLICTDNEVGIFWKPGVFRVGDKTVIANRHCALLMSDEATYPFDYTPRRLAVLTRDRLRDLLKPENCDAYEEYKEVCPECEGNEHVTASYTSVNKDGNGTRCFTFEVDCPICGGSGKVTKRKRIADRVVNDDSNVTFDGGSTKYPYRYLRLVEPLADILGVKEITVESMGAKLAIRLADDMRFVVLGDHYRLEDTTVFNIRLNNKQRMIVAELADAKVKLL